MNAFRSERHDDNQPVSIADIIDLQARNYPNAPALASRVSGAWNISTWKEFSETSKSVGLGLLALGLEPGDVIAISSWTRKEWAFLDVGAQGVGVVVAGIYPTETTQRISYLLGDCGASAVIVENQEHFDKVQPLLAKSSNVKHIIHIEPIMCSDESINIIPFETLLAKGRELSQNSPKSWDEARQHVRSDNLAILIYTSGTTGEPKGAMITHANIVHQALKSPALYQMQKGWKRPCYLPLCHVAERMFTYFCFASAGVSYFVPTPNLLNEWLPEIKPNFILGVPRVYEKLRQAADEWAKQQSVEFVTQYRQDLELCTRVSRSQLTGEPVSVLEQAAYAAACTRQRKGVLAAIGLEGIAVLTSGGVKFPDELMIWYWAHGLPTYELYGMSETGIISTNCPSDVRLGSTGVPAGLGHVKISEDGEVLISGAQVFSGYLNKSDKNADAFAGDWFRTGDVGRFDEDGYLYIVDRIKDIMITGTGKNIAPSAIEAPLRRHALISDAILVGEGRNYLTALIVLDPITIQAEYPEKYCEGALDLTQLAIDEDIQKAVAMAIEGDNKNVSRPERIRKFKIIPRVFAPTDEEVTPTMKLKRNVIYRKYQDLIEEMYA